jgi:uncharacterized damage-inducible protein DinB
MKQLLEHYADYDLWANTRFLERLQRESDTVLDKPVPNSFPNLRATVLHIRDAEHAWWCRLIGSPVRWPAEEDRALATLLPHTKRLHALVHKMDPGALYTEHVYHDLRGNAHRQPAWMMLLHCLNHSTQHRGQLITMMRAIGLQDIPANDLVVYQRTLT